MIAPFPTPEETAAGDMLVRDQGEVDLLPAFRSMSARRKAASLRLVRYLEDDDPGLGAAAIDFLRESGLPRRTAVRAARCGLGRMAA